MPPALGRFSTSTCCPRVELISCVTTRAVMSATPPAAKGTRSRTGRVGYCAAATGANIASASAHAYSGSLGFILGKAWIVVGAQILHHREALNGRGFPGNA